MSQVEATEPAEENAEQGNGGQSFTPPPDANDSSAPLTASTQTSRRRRVHTDCLKGRMATSLEDIHSLKLWKGVIAEFVGTLLLVLIGCGSCVSVVQGESPSVVQISLCFGLSVATIVWGIFHISGGQINPAITIALLVTRKISLVKAFFFVVAQLVGGITGAALLYAMTPEEFRGHLGSTLLNDNLNVGMGVGVEIFITFVLVFTVFASLDSRRKDLNGSTPLSIGLSVAMCHLFAVGYTGAGMNTARCFGPAVITGNWEHHWIYWVGPISGGIVAGLLYEYLFAANASFGKVRACLLSSDYDDAKIPAKKTTVFIVNEDPEDPVPAVECVALTNTDPMVEEVVVATDSA